MRENPEFAVCFTEPETPENIGFLARTMKNFGLSKLYLTGISEVPDKANITATHGRDILQDAEITTLEALSKKYKLIGTSAKKGWEFNLNRNWTVLEKFKPVKGSCIVFGRESKGLFNEEIALCDEVLYIQASDEYPTLNITHAAAIVLYHIFKTKTEEIPEAGREVKNQLVVYFEEILDKLDYDDRRIETEVQIWKNITGRRITAREAHGLCGALKDINNKLG